MRGTIKLGRIAGIEIGVHYTWLFAFLLFMWLFAQMSLPDAYPGWSRLSYWLSGIIASLMIFMSVLVHEFCHSLVARNRGMKVDSIILFIFGGVSNIETEPERASVEFIMSAAGPVSSLILGGIFAGLVWLVENSAMENTPLYAVLFILAYTNIILAIFNIIPGFPLDGGRVLRSILWGATGNLQKATTIAGNIGRAVGWIMILIGIAWIFNQKIWILPTGFINGIWLIFIGWFLASAADNALREQSMQQRLAGVLVKDVMDRNPECVSPAVSFESVVHDSFIKRGRRALPVCNEKGLLGIVTLADVKRLPHELWSNTPVQEIMTPFPAITKVNENDDLNAALKTLAKNDLNQIPVMSGEHLAGLLSRADVLRYLQTAQELGIKLDKNSRRPF
ncbi:MAG: site-2 protease family protein [Dehalococcoidales bacterium]|nr:site-2 protease family protein [Dehalococcoidales bacterium]